MKSAVKASRFAKAKYSQFNVGAALLTLNGEIYTGCNIESSSYGLTICAERVALFKALSEGDENFSSLAIYARAQPFCPPCGACLQVLYDYAPKLIILLTDGENHKKLSILDFLPYAFNDNHLSNK